MIFLFVTWFNWAYAASSLPDPEIELSEIPQQPTAPPELIQREPSYVLSCERYFLFQGQEMGCDSHLGRDGKGLRKVMEGVPSALDQLDLYEKNREKINISGYLGSVGLLAAFVGNFLSPPSFDSSGSPRVGGAFILGGLFVAGNAFLYSFGLIKVNEVHFQNAVRLYNEAYKSSPEKLIELQTR